MGKKEAIGPCWAECPDRSAECRLTCEAYRKHHEERLRYYEEQNRARHFDRALGAAQYHSRTLKRYNRFK